SHIVSTHQADPLLIVVSAMGKTTNQLEKLTSSYVKQTGDAFEILEQVKAYHDGILHPLFPNRDHPVYHEVANRFVEIEWILEEPVADSYAYLYDQIVAVGELVSTTIVCYYLNRSEERRVGKECRTTR